MYRDAHRTANAVRELYGRREDLVVVALLRRLFCPRSVTFADRLRRYLDVDDCGLGLGKLERVS